MIRTAKLQSQEMAHSPSLSCLCSPHKSKLFSRALAYFMFAFFLLLSLLLPAHAKFTSNDLTLDNPIAYLDGSLTFEQRRQIWEQISLLRAVHKLDVRVIVQKSFPEIAQASNKQGQTKKRSNEDVYADKIMAATQMGKNYSGGAILLLVGTTDRLTRLQSKGAIQQTLNPGLSSAILKNVGIPHFKGGQYVTGVVEVLKALDSIQLAGSFQPTLLEPLFTTQSGIPTYEPFVKEHPFSVLMSSYWGSLLIIFTIFSLPALFVLYAYRHHKRTKKEEALARMRHPTFYQKLADLTQQNPVPTEALRRLLDKHYPQPFSRPIDLLWKYRNDHELDLINSYTTHPQVVAILHQRAMEAARRSSSRRTSSSSSSGSSSGRSSGGSASW